MSIRGNRRWDAMTDRDDDSDPLLVRPYLLGDPEDSAPPASAQTWPEAAVAPAPAPAQSGATVIVPAGVRPHRALRRRPLVLLAAVLVLVLVGGAAALASLLPDPAPRTALPLDLPVPSVAGSEAASATTAPTTRAAPTITAAPRTRATRRPTATATAPPAATSTTIHASPAPARTTTSRPDPLLAPPAADRVGRISGPGGLCLDLNGAVPSDGNHIQVFVCNDTVAQVWTLASDGTLRVVGKCAVVADDGTVRIAGCDGRRSAQWRTGRDRELVSIAADDCLTDPGDGTRSGAGVRVEDCSGADRQRWQTP
jgi:Ricin-type beta-trefoil lectin domain